VVYARTGQLNKTLSVIVIQAGADTGYIRSYNQQRLLQIIFGKI